MARKMTRGRQKIEMKKIEDEESLQICFSKRHKGLFKKASELCTLTGAELVVLVYSPSGKPVTIGQPNVNTVIDRFLSQGEASPLEQDLGRQYRILAQERMEECSNVTMSMKEKKLRLQTLEEGMREWEFKNPYKYGKDYDLMNRIEVGILIQALIQAQAAMYSWEQERQRKAAGASSSRVTMALDDLGIINAATFLMDPMITSVNMAGSSNPVNLMKSVNTLLGSDSPNPFEMLEEAKVPSSAAKNASALVEPVDPRGKAIEVSSSSSGGEDEWMSFLRNSPGN